MDRGLDEDRKARWETTLVHIADTTWSRNSRDLHLMTAINLYTGKLDLFLTDENGEGAKLCNDKTFKTAWQLYLETHSQNHVSIGKGQSLEL